MGVLHDILRRRPPAGPAGPLRVPRTAASYDRAGRVSNGVPAVQRGATNARARVGAQIAARYDRPVPSGVQFPYRDIRPVVRRPVRSLGFHGGLRGYGLPHRLDSN